MKKLAKVVIIVLILILSVAGWALATGTSTYAGFPVVNLLLNGKPAATDSPPIMIDGRTYVPLRFISESLGASVAWDETTQTVSIDNSINVPEDTTPPISVTDKGVTITLKSVNTGDHRYTTLILGVTNNSVAKVKFKVSETKIYCAGLYFEKPNDVSSSFVNDILPGQTIQGEVRFPALPTNEKVFKFYAKALIGDPYVEFVPIFNVVLK
ncbi:hypothetical protein Psfp_00528 [Pelotomaculum sp. FP]|uniref:copper amine oxidase N-terminal domain-containing protein n=1 Tax=Pelotomaculum sp. FP TaxID=261474 RepID=UPI001065A2F7|nr:copper amine oxidase N-terminal domain-containing protein [Pelotomaculum sp. FP]TEB17304.1 hypothetical protein Psfp_00528 [Pelotomaculum sp. FP]